MTPSLPALEISPPGVLREQRAELPGSESEWSVYSQPGSPGSLRAAIAIGCLKTDSTAAAGHGHQKPTRSQKDETENTHTGSDHQNLIFQYFLLSLIVLESLNKGGGEAFPAFRVVPYYHPLGGRYGVTNV